MAEQDPLQRSRLGLRGVLLVSGGVLVASSIFLLPGLGLLQGPTPTTSLSVPPAPTTATATDGGPAAADAPVADGSTSFGPSGGSASSAGPVSALLPVYWLGDVEGSDRLFREFLTSAGPAPTDPIAEAVRMMLAGEPLDPDYHSPWRPASGVSSSISTRNVITLDIASDAFGGSLPEDEARLAVQQLVYTATAAAANAGLIAGGEASSVVVLVDGAAGYRAFDAVDLDGEWLRDASVLSSVWIIDPQEDTQVAGAVTVHGVAPTDGDEVDWRIDRLDGDPTEDEVRTSLFRDGSADVDPGEAPTGTYSFSESLPPGRYGITVSASVDGITAEDTKTVTVR
jgi:hypothetical protein